MILKTSIAVALAVSALSPSGAAQQIPVSSPETAAPEPIAPGEVNPAPVEPNKRVFGVLPNYRTADGRIPYQPISAKRKLTIAAKDSFDWPLFVLAGAFAGLHQLEVSEPSFGQGLKGYGKYYGTAYGDQMIGNMLSEGVLPALFHDDPRYFRRGEGSIRGRIWYAATRVVVGKRDNGKWSFNTSEWLGNGIAASIGASYYPSNRSGKDVAENTLIAVGTDAVSNVMKEFWPDIKRKYFHKHEK